MIDRQTFEMNDAGVSPVVGVILMVAVTVILAAVIGTFVLDLGGDVGQNAQAGVTFDEDSANSVSVQLNSVQTADAIWVQADGAEADDYSGGFDASDANDFDDGSGLLTRDGEGGVGTTVTVNTSELDDGTISVIGEVDGEASVIQTYSFTGGGAP